jgi:hypothetical protein
MTTITTFTTDSTINTTKCAGTILPAGVKDGLVSANEATFFEGPSLFEIVSYLVVYVF